jgi:sulfatase maturation enzyme AslB (radical SAM superfamily)
VAPAQPKEIKSAPMSNFIKKFLSVIFVPLIPIITRLLFIDYLRTIFIRLIKHRLSGYMLDLQHSDKGRRKIEEQRTLLSLAILDTVDRLIGKGRLKPKVSQTSVKLWAHALLKSRGANKAVRYFNQQFGCDPPWFLTLSPGHACNLGCEGCYASSGQAQSQLSWSLIDRIITEAKELWDIKLVVLSGGEPVLYRSEGKDMLDIVEKHCDLLFLMFTNGTLVDDQVAARLAKLGNLTPAFSVEGMAKNTDLRRGAGVFQAVIDAMDRTGRAGVPFGISVTVTRDNCEEVISREFLDFFFRDKGAFY